MTKHDFVCNLVMIGVTYHHFVCDVALFGMTKHDFVFDVAMFGVTKHYFVCDVAFLFLGVRRLPSHSMANPLETMLCGISFNVHYIAFIGSLVFSSNKINECGFLNCGYSGRAQQSKFYSGRAHKSGHKVLFNFFPKKLCLKNCYSMLNPSK